VFLAELKLGAKPLREASSEPIGVLGDFDGFVPQQAHTVSLMRDHLHWSQSLGLKGIAIVNATALMKIQWRRLSEGARVEYFSSRADALRWLRRPYADHD